MVDPITENTSTKRIEESGWTFFPPKNLVSLEIMPPAILDVWEAWIREPDYYSINDQTSKVSEVTQRIQLAEADTLVVLEALLNPPEPTADLVAAFRRHREEQE
jgi:hypothetical protein